MLEAIGYGDLLGVYVSIALILIGIYGFHRSRKKQWLLLALGAFISSANIIGSTASFFTRDLWLIMRLYDAQILGGLIIVGVAWALIVQDWRKCRARRE